MVIWNGDCERCEVFVEDNEGLSVYELNMSDLILFEAMELEELI